MVVAGAAALLEKRRRATRGLSRSLCCSFHRATGRRWLPGNWPAAAGPPVFADWRRKDRGRRILGRGEEAREERDPPAVLAVRWLSPENDGGGERGGYFANKEMERCGWFEREERKKVAEREEKR
ncbi:hypothetical protein AABB24_038433 [Solanum stoloniferum]|uniref:Uncharacterized protein n=1 Tax=Solanum stoloniferum TaxID=62892 RepID=A0ABD2QXG2_9SOLN